MAKKSKSQETTLVFKIDELKRALEFCMKAKIPVFIHGKPGVGKSDCVRQMGAEQGRPVIDLRMSLLNPVDLRGVPVAKDGTTAWWAPCFLPREDNETANAILFLDEMNAAPPAVQAAAYQLVLDRRVGEYRLPDGVDVIAAGNRGTDRAIVYEMSSALRNRFVHYEVVEDLDVWKDWAVRNGVRDEVLSFLNYKQDRLFFFDPKVHTRQFPTPRSWAYASRLLDVVGPQSLNTTALFAGALGDGVATEFAGFLKVAGKIPNAEDIVVGGNMKIKAPEDAAQNYAFSGALVGVASRAKDSMEAGKNLSQYCASSMKAEFAVLTCKDYARSDVFAKIYNKLILTKEWKAFADKYGAHIIH